ncbi:MAG: histidine phosphatase family protein [Promethearchaeota archaeon]
MLNSVYFLRHAETEVDLNIPVREWSITSEGRTESRELASTDAFGVIEGIVHSSEKKARQTADVFAEGLDVQMYELPDFDELRREHEKSIREDEYRVKVRATLTNMESNVPGWESGSEALRRFESGVKKIGLMFHRKTLLVVSHGIVLTAYFCKLKGFEAIAYERWNQLKWLSWGLVRGDRVLIDIV